ncbi:NAD(P)H-binding protein [Neobacillus sp. DY30]|uniref:NAD(P)H-binding protein n=1 Tax=Neobacillus sp. DY30 TaxID=3047871 RepID=UPI0024C042B8|nr:NAD(P)H-binding protein [Neobacillus sp. DY30]WHX97965.1 NAD(P)H-binding protein [Neobacillus sp. DY30]
MEKSLRIAILGGTGKVGRYIAEKALESGFQVRMLIRNLDKLAYFDNRIEIIKGDAQNIDSIRCLLKDCNIVINTLGQPVKDLPIYSSVTNNVLSIMNEFAIRRYIGVTGASLNIEGDNKKLINRIGAKIFEILFSKMMIDKKKELSILINSNMDWTLVRLPFVIEGSETGNIKVNLSDMEGTRITNADIAKFIINQVSETKYIRKTPFISN